MLKVFRNLTKKDMGFALACLALVIVQVWLELTMPDYTQKLTSSVSSGMIEMREVLANGGMMLLCAAGSLVSSICCSFFASRISANFAMSLRTKLFSRIADFSAAEINRFTTPSLITRTTNDVVQLQMLIVIGLQVFIRAPIMAIWAITKISVTSFEWTAAALVAVAVIIVTDGVLVILCFPKFQKIQKLTDDLNDVTRENLNGVRVVRAFNAESFQQGRFEAVNEDITGKNLFVSRTMGLMHPVMTLCMSGLTLAIYWIGAYLISQAPMPEKAVVMGNMIAFTQYAMQIVMSFMMLTVVFVVLPRNIVSARRINEVLDTKPSVTYPETPAKTEENVHGKIEFRNVSFAYTDANEPCIRNLNFTVEPGETFAIIGATGTGKSTLISLLPRFYDVTEGELLLDGADIRTFSQAQLGNTVSIAPQKAILFGGTVKSNVTYGAKAPVADDDARLLDALHIAQADFVLDVENGVNAEVAQGGTNFSGGQKQRLSIARAVYKDAEIYIFDDSFSALDYKTDMLVRKALREKLNGKTIIIVAQRIGTIMNADKILVLDDGEIAGIGTHRELLDHCPVYKEIALSQLSEEEL